MNYAWLGTCIAIIIAGWLIARAIETLGDRIVRPVGNPIAQEALAVSHVAATLIGCAINNPVYISRMTEIRLALKKARDLTLDNWQAEKVEERKQAEAAVRQYEEQLLATDLFYHGRRPYIDLALDIWRAVSELRAKGATYEAIESEQMINQNTTEERARQIERARILQTMARP